MASGSMPGTPRSESEIHSSHRLGPAPAQVEGGYCPVPLNLIQNQIPLPSAPPQTHQGFTEEYERALGWVRSGLNLTVDFNASVFETTIRVVGGFLAAYELTGDEVLLKRSLQVAERLLPAYDTPTGIPYGTINLKTLAPRNPKWASKASSLAEFGTHQLEWYKLSALSGDRRFADLAEHSIRYLNEQFPGQGLMPLFLSPSTGKFTSRRISLGALGDSYYEYLLKMWLLKGKTDDMYRAMWEQVGLFEREE